MMINYYNESKVLLVLQIDHSRMAGYLAAHWGNENFAELAPYAPMVVAAGEHDSGWWDWEMMPTLSDDGYPIDYQGSTRHLGKTKLELYMNTIERVTRVDPYAGYIVLLHQVGLLTQGQGLLPRMPDFSKQEHVPDFLEGRERDRLNLLETLVSDSRYREHATDEALWRNYKLMEIFDQFSQFVCNRYPFNSTMRTNGPSNTLSDAPIPTFPGEDDVSISIDIQDENSAVVTPYPFDIDPLPISFQGRLMPTGSFASRDEFLRAYYKAERLDVRYLLRSA